MGSKAMTMLKFAAGVLAVVAIAANVSAIRSIVLPASPRFGGE